MRKSILLVLVFVMLSVILIPPSSSTVSIYSELMSGTTISRDIILNNTENRDIILHVSTAVLPDGDGVNVTYFPTFPLVLKKGCNVTVEMTIKADILLMPQMYTIDTTFYYEEILSSSIKKSYGGRKYTVAEKDDEVVDDVLPPDDEPPVVDEEQDDTVIFVEISKTNINYLWALLIIPVVIAVVGLLFYSKNKRR